MRLQVATWSPIPLVQLALGSTAAPPLAAVVTLTGWFRGRVLRGAIERMEGDRRASWADASPKTRRRLSGLSGKDEAGAPLLGHSHARYLLWRDEERLTRLLVHRPSELGDWERDAILRAAAHPLGCAPGAPGAWRVHLVPLDRHVPPPPGFDGRTHRVWESVIPYVPPRHLLDRRGKPRAGESVEEQIASELEQRCLPPADRVEQRDAPWMRVHQARRPAGRRSTDDVRRAYWLRITLSRPVAGPLTLGHSSFFGLGLFRPGVRG